MRKFKTFLRYLFFALIMIPIFALGWIIDQISSNTYGPHLG